MLFPIVTSWTTPLGAASSGPLASDGGRLFVTTTDGVARALQRFTGETLWQVPGRAGALAATAEALLLREPDGTLWSLEPGTGSARWRVETGIAGEVPPAIDGDAVFVAGAGMARVALRDGAPAWSAPEGAVVATPVVAGGHVYSPEDDGTLRARDAATGRTLWTFKSASALATSPVVDARGRVLLGTTDRRFVALDPKDGSVDWTWRLGADVRTPPAVVDGIVVFAAYDDVLYGLNAGNGHLAWRAPLPSRPQSGPLVVRGAVLVACHGGRPGETYLAGFDGRTGERQGDLRATGEARTAPLLVEGHLYLGMRERAVLALQLGG